MCVCGGGGGGVAARSEINWKVGTGVGQKSLSVKNSHNYSMINFLFSTTHFSSLQASAHNEKIPTIKSQGKVCPKAFFFNVCILV